MVEVLQATILMFTMTITRNPSLHETTATVTRALSLTTRTAQMIPKMILVKNGRYKTTETVPKKCRKKSDKATSFEVRATFWYQEMEKTLYQSSASSSPARTVVSFPSLLLSILSGTSKISSSAYFPPASLRRIYQPDKSLRAATWPPRVNRTEAMLLVAAGSSAESK